MVMKKLESHVEKMISAIITDNIGLVIDVGTIASTHRIAVFALQKTSTSAGYSARNIVFATVDNVTTLKADKHYRFFFRNMFSNSTRSSDKKLSPSRVIVVQLTSVFESNLLFN